MGFAIWSAAEERIKRIDRQRRTFIIERYDCMKMVERYARENCDDDKDAKNEPHFVGVMELLVKVTRMQFVGVARVEGSSSFRGGGPHASAVAFRCFSLL